MNANHQLVSQISRRVGEGDRCLLDKVAKKYGDEDLIELQENYKEDDTKLSQKLAELAQLRKLKGSGTHLQLKDRRRLKKNKGQTEDY